jgi:hypothetical protein
MSPLCQVKIMPFAARFRRGLQVTSKALCLRNTDVIDTRRSLGPSTGFKWTEGSSPLAPQQCGDKNPY